MADTVGIGAEALVKAVHLQIPFYGVLAGKAASLLSSGPLKDCRFGNTSELILTLDSRSTTSSDLVVAEMEANIKEFAATITRMFPTVRDPLIYVDMLASMRYRGKLVDLVDLVAAGRLGLSIEDRARGYHSLDLPSIARLEHIMLDCDTFGDTHIELVRKSSQSLTCIHLFGTTPQDIYDIICDSEGNIVEYP
ncbi:hypothetical protein EC988_008284, partial [Linderina pennispora]